MLSFLIGACLAGGSVPRNPKVSSFSVPRSPGVSSIRSLQKILQGFTGAATLAALYTMGTVPANAKVFFDAATYGDRETTIATINKCKQKIRNAIINNPALASEFYLLAINDALGFDVNSNEGGPDGSIILDEEMKWRENLNLSRGLSEIVRIKKELQRTNALSFADVCSFSGAEALEALGCPRVVVQVGRTDAVSSNKKKGIDLEIDSGEAVLEKFTSSGVTKTDAVLILGGLGEIQRILIETAAAGKVAVKDEDEEEDEEGTLEGDERFQDAVPATFGRADQIFGAKIGKGKFTGKYLQGVLKERGGTSVIDKLLFEDASLRAIVSKYAGNDNAFTEALIPAYLRLSLLGAAYSTRNS